MNEFKEFFFLTSSYIRSVAILSLGYALPSNRVNMTASLINSVYRLLPNLLAACWILETQGQVSRVTLGPNDQGIYVVAW